MYGGNVQVVEDLIKRKTEEGLVREHPDFPGNKSMNLYYVRGLQVQVW